MAILCKKNFYCKNLFSAPRKSNSFHPLKKSWRPPFLSPGCMREKNVAKYFRDTRGWRWWPAVAGCLGRDVTRQTWPGAGGHWRRPWCPWARPPPVTRPTQSCQHSVCSHNIANCVMFCKTENSQTCDCSLQQWGKQWSKGGEVLVREKWSFNIDVKYFS